MEILNYEPSMLPAVTALYNREVEGVPHCYSVNEERMAAELASVVGGKRHYRLHTESVFVAVEGDSVQGFVHASIGPTEEKPERGSIRFLAYERGCRKSGQSLLDAAEGFFRAHGQERIDAFESQDRYPFYHLPYAGLSERLEHVHALVRLNGYRMVSGEVVLDWPRFESRSPGVSPDGLEIALEWREGRGHRPNLLVSARADGEQVGYCSCLSAMEFAKSEAAQDWLFVDRLFIDEPFQGKGLGRHLLRRGMTEMHAKGYRHAVISTDWTNHRALLFYSNSGFRRVDWTYGYGKGLDLESLPKGGVE